MTDAVIRLENITKKFADVVAVDNVSLEITDGEFLALLGPSGCGKTTLLRMLGGFDRPSSGRIWMDGKDITDLPPNKRPVNMLFQSYAVFPHMTVRDNVGYGLRVDGVGKVEITDRVDEALALVQMSEFADRMPDKLSGGQRQRVALARALIKKPRVLLLDEPLSALDAKLREAMQSELVKLQQTVGITFIVVTHDQNEALSVAGRIAVMQAGKFRQIAAPRVLYEEPDSRFVAGFIGRMNLIAATVEEVTDDTYRLAAAGINHLVTPRHGLELAVGEKVFIGVRPEKIYFLDDPPTASGQVFCHAVLRSFSYHGNETLLQCETDAGDILMCSVANVSRASYEPMIGETGWLAWAVADMTVLKD